MISRHPVSVSNGKPSPKIWSWNFNQLSRNSLSIYRELFNKTTMLAWIICTEIQSRICEVWNNQQVCCSVQRWRVPLPDCSAIEDDNHSDVRFHFKIIRDHNMKHHGDSPSSGVKQSHNRWMFSSHVTDFFEIVQQNDDNAFILIIG